MTPYQSSLLNDSKTPLNRRVHAIHDMSPISTQKHWIHKKRINFGQTAHIMSKREMIGTTAA
jgi:hypothetical protein